MRFDGEKLKQIRLDKEMTLDAVTVRLSGIRKYTRQAVSSWEHGVAEPPTVIIYELSRIFNVEISYFFA